MAIFESEDGKWFYIGYFIFRVIRNKPDKPDPGHLPIITAIIIIIGILIYVL